jgi:hypothetical protein
MLGILTYNALVSALVSSGTASAGAVMVLGSGDYCEIHSREGFAMTNLTGLLFNRGIADAMPLFLAQSSSSGEELAVSAGANIVSLIIQIALYVLIAFCTQTFLKKLDYENAWLAWIPFANTYALLDAGEQENPILWTILACIPCVGLVSLIKLIPAYINICERLGKPPAILWTFLLCGLGAIIVPVVLAFT